jgi:hypothetical protein
MMIAVSSVFCQLRCNSLLEVRSSLALMWQDRASASLADFLEKG